MTVQKAVREEGVVERPLQKGIRCAEVNKFVDANDQLLMAAGTVVAGLIGTHKHTGLT